MASVFNRYWRDPKGTNRSGMVRLSGSCIVGASGAVTSYDAPGFTITKQTAAGRYRIQLVDQDGTTAATPAYIYDAGSSEPTAPLAFQDFNFTVVSAVADSAMTTDSALKAAIRNYNTHLGYFDVQFYKDVTSTTSETHVDCDIESGGKFFIGFSVKTSSAVP